MTPLPAQPQVGRPAPFTLPERARRRLDNGFRSTLAAVGSVPKASVRLVLDAGGVHEAPGQTWLSRYASHFLKEGTERLDADALAVEVAGLGGELHVEADDDLLVLRAAVLSEHAPDLVRLLGEVATTPRFPESEATRLLDDLRRELDLAHVQPQVLALARFREVIYGDHPYGRFLPSGEELDAFTTEAARSFFESNRAAVRANLYVGGRFDDAAVGEAVREAFGEWPGGDESTGPRPSPTSERAVYLIDRPGAEQSTIHLGLPVPDPTHDDYVALIVTNALLGGSFYSRIIRNIREDKGYTYSPRSALSLRRRDATWVQMADVTTAVTGASLHEIFFEIDRLRSEPPEADELEGIQRYVAGSHLLRHATAPGLLDQIGFIDLHGLDDAWAEAFVDRVYAVTPPEVSRIASEHLEPERMAIVVVGDVAQIREQVEPYGRLVEATATT